MKRKIWVWILLCLSAALICGCGGNEPEATEQCEEFAQQFRLATQYNERLLGRDIRTGGKGDILDSYLDILDTGDGVIGSLVLPGDLGKKQIRHGLGGAKESAGAGHLPGSALPVGGAGNHAVLVCYGQGTDALREGDIFEIVILDKSFSYQVTEVSRIPREGALVPMPEEGEDLCTLIIPGKESHTFLKGRRFLQEEPTSDPLLYLFCSLAGVLMAVLMPLMGRLLIKR